MVYCQNCVNFRESCCEYGCSQRCVLDNKTEYNHPARPVKVYGGQEQMEERNKNNDCKDFVDATRWQKFLRRFK